MTDIALGRRRVLGLRPAPEIVAWEPALRRHAGRPWFRAAVGRLAGVPPCGLDPGATGLFKVGSAALARHTLIGGATGSGKSRLQIHVLRESLRLGLSQVLLDPKGETADLLLAVLAEEGFPPDRVTVLDPRDPGDGVPGWNPLCGPGLALAVRDFVSVLERTSTSWGPRLSDVLQNALLVVGSHRLSLYELTRFLTREEYRERLLRAPAAPEDPEAYREAVQYFRHEFGAWARSERVQAVSPVINKVREFVRNPFLRALLLSRRQTLRLERPWERQEVILVKLSQAALGDEGARLLAGLLVNQLLRTAARAGGPGSRGVLLALDELPALERAVGPAVLEAVTMARSAGLHLLVAFQHLGGISPELRQALLANAAVQVFFRQGHADANLVAEQLALGTAPSLARAVAAPERADPATGLPPRLQWKHRIEDPAGRPLRVSGGSGPEEDGWWGGGDPVDDAYALARRAGIRRLYVRAADTGEPAELAGYVSGLEPGEYWVERPRLRLAVAFPRPRLTAVERWGAREAALAWGRLLRDLPVQEAVVRVPGEEPALMRVADVAPPGTQSGPLRAFAAASRSANAQPAAEVRETLRWRETGIEAVAAGRRPDEEVDDGSIA